MEILAIQYYKRWIKEKIEMMYRIHDKIYGKKWESRKLPQHSETLRKQAASSCEHT